LYLTYLFYHQTDSNWGCICHFIHSELHVVLFLFFGERGVENIGQVWVPTVVWVKKDI